MTQSLSEISIYSHLQRDCLGGWDVVKAALWGEFSSDEGKYDKILRCQVLQRTI